MTIKKMTCIECPKGCSLKVEIESGRVVNVTGNSCPKGAKYAVSEVENPVRILTSSVLAEGLGIKMIPVRTDKPVPKSRLQEAMFEIKKIRVDRPVPCGGLIKKDLLGLGIDLIATRDAK